MSATEVIRKAKNTFYINYTFDGDSTINNTTGYTITLPPPVLNIKANNAFLSITNLAFQNFDNEKTIDKNLDAIVVRTSIPTSSCIDSYDVGDETIGTVGYCETILFDTVRGQKVDTTNRNFYGYTNFSDFKVLCTNPLSNSYNVKFCGLDQLTPVAFNTTTAKIDIITLTLKVELVEEEIF